MPAADITSVSITFENGLKREEYGPTRKASVTLTAAVDKGEDGVVALNYIGTLARAKVADMLGIQLPAEGIAALGAEPGLDGGTAAGEPATPKPRQRRSPAATAPAAPLDQGASGTDGQTGSGQQPAPPADETIPPTSSDSSGSTDEGDDWSTGADEPKVDAPAEPQPITDADLAMHCSKHAQRLGGGEKVKEVISSYKPNNWNKPRFGVTDIVATQRPGFVEKLEELTT